MSNTAFGVIKQDYTYASMPPTRVCNVCGHRESDCNYAKDEFWLCPDCLNKLRNLIAKETQYDLS